jgi:hypothetical protein
VLISYLDGVIVSIVTGRLLHGLTYFCESASFETCHSIFTSCYYQYLSKMQSEDTTDYDYNP